MWTASWPSGIEEMLRWVSPVVYMRRTAKEAVRLGDQEIAAGDKVVMYYGAANRDPEAFEDPERLDLTRKPNEHVAFGGGRPAFLPRCPHRPDRDRGTLARGLDEDGRPGVRRRAQSGSQSNFVSGLKHLPVRYRPGARSG